MDIARDKAGASGRNAAVKVALILGANLAVAGPITILFRVLTGTDPFHPGGTSAGFAALVGWLHVSFGATAAAMRTSARFLNDAEEADDLRREGWALLLGAVALIAAGVSLIVLSLAGPNRPIAPGTGAIAALSLNLLALVVATLRWRGLDELNRAVARDAGSLAFTWLSLGGGTWALLAHLGLAATPGPLDWLTMLAGSSFLASLVALARKGGFQPSSGA
jgi:hypothetical protein